MSQSDITFFEVDFERDKYAIKTANTAYYAFIGEEKYRTINNVFAPEDQQLFMDHCTPSMYGIRFQAHIVRNNSKYPIIACVLPANDESRLIVQMMSLDYLYQSSSAREDREEEYISILGQLGAISYCYTSDLGNIEFFNYELGKKSIRSEKVDLFLDALHVSDSKEDSHLKLLKESLLNGSKSFDYIFKSLDTSPLLIELAPKEYSEIRITGNTFYYHGAHLKTIGTIRFTNGSVDTSFSYLKDQLTGLLLKDDITNIAKNRVTREFLPTTLAIVDIDDFKVVNDTKGHVTGDDVLRQCAEIMENCVGDRGIVGRIGGDEFLIVLFDVNDTEERKSIFRSIKNHIVNLYSEEKDGFRVSTSIGSAHYPDDIDNFDDLYRLTDLLVYRAKTKGKNRYTIYDYKAQGSVTDLLSKGMNDLGNNNHLSHEKSDAVCELADQLYLKEFSIDDNDSLESLKNHFEEIRSLFATDRILLYDVDAQTLVFQTGKFLLDDAILADTIEYTKTSDLEKLYHSGLQKGDMILYNNILNIANTAPDLYATLQSQKVLSLQQHRITGASGKQYLLSLEDIALQHTWNTKDLALLRVLSKALATIL